MQTITEGLIKVDHYHHHHFYQHHHHTLIISNIFKTLLQILSLYDIIYIFFIQEMFSIIIWYPLRYQIIKKWGADISEVNITANENGIVSRFNITLCQNDANVSYVSISCSWRYHERTSHVLKRFFIAIPLHSKHPDWSD